ncbi:hypothetical protein T492DRAFT_969052 [Pavlovales sp. CCMP2436]|nr:hypothetical protein T492DRAFT_969052 [Pavlovales sp. CCMP2436]
MSRRQLPRGNRDAPGQAPLAAFHPLLHCGNEIAASLAEPGFFGAVVSTVPPLDKQLSRAPGLTTKKLYFLDELGRESVANESYARECILAGAQAVGEALADGQRTLVHCSFGQNRSSSICIAYAIIHQGWSFEEATEYVCEQNRAHRQYYAQQPCSNPTFHRILKQLSDENEDSRTPHANWGPEPTKKSANLLTAWLGLASLGGASLLLRRQPSSPPASAAAAAPSAESITAAELANSPPLSSLSSMSSLSLASLVAEPAAELIAA